VPGGTKHRGLTINCTGPHRTPLHQRRTYITGPHRVLGGFAVGVVSRMTVMTDELASKSSCSFTLATVLSRRYRRRQAYEYRQDLMYLSMVICIFISFPLSVVLKCQRHFVVKFWLRGSFRVRRGRLRYRQDLTVP